MLSRQEIAEIVKDISLNCEWELLLLEDNVYRQTRTFYESDIGPPEVTSWGRLYLQIQFDDIDNITGLKGYRAHCRKWYLSNHMTKQELVRTAWKAYEAAVIHEAQEKFLYKGRMIYGPHIDVEALWEVAPVVEHRVGEQPVAVEDAVVNNEVVSPYTEVLRGRAWH